MFQSTCARPLAGTEMTAKLNIVASQFLWLWWFWLTWLRLNDAIQIDRSNFRKTSLYCECFDDVMIVSGTQYVFFDISSQLTMTTFTWSKRRNYSTRRIKWCVCNIYTTHSSHLFAMWSRGAAWCHIEYDRSLGHAYHRQWYSLGHTKVDMV